MTTKTYNSAISGNMLKRIKQILAEGAGLRQSISQDASLLAQITKAAEKLRSVVNQGGTIYTCGNGGSACDAMHFCEELVARFKKNRPGIRAMHFCDPGTITCWSNDFDFSSVFARQVQTFCTPHDILVVFSTSGASPNIVEAVQAARACSTYSLGLSGKGGGKLKDLCDLAVIVPSDDTAQIQEIHMALVHIFCELLENA